MTKREIRIFQTEEELAENAARKWIEVQEEAVIKRGVFTVCLSGGKTPGVLLKKLASLSESGLIWDDTHIFMADERMVDSDSADSNYRMLKTELVDKVGIEQSKVHPVPVDRSSSSRSANEYENLLIDFFKPDEGLFPIFDLILLGIGTDGHTASLFPGSEALRESRRLVVADDEERAGYKRVSLTLPVINSARNIIFLVAGEKKSEAVKKVTRGNPDSPASLVNPVNGNLFFMLDKQSGKYLEE